MCLFLIAPPYQAAFRELTRPVFLGFQGRLEFEAIGLKGRHVWLENHAVPFRDDSGEYYLLYWEFTRIYFRAETV